MGCAASTGAAAVGEPDAALHEEYDITQELWRGEHCSSLLAVRSESGQQVELRQYPKFSERSKQYQAVKKEADTLRKLVHPHCATLVQFHETAKHIILAKEAFLHGSLMERILTRGPMKEGSAAAVMSQVVSAISYMHTLGVCHRNLNPKNIMMLSNDEESNQYEMIKVVDFEQSSSQGDEVEDTMATYRGSPEYTAPELVAVGYAGSSEMYGVKVDVWSIGAVTYTCLSGSHPFWHFEDNLPTMLNAILKGNFKFEDRRGSVWMTIDPEAKAFISRCMKVNPLQRLNALQCKRQKWLKTGQTAARRGGSDVSSVRSTNSAMSRRSGASTVSAKSTARISSVILIPYDHNTKALVNDAAAHKRSREVAEDTDCILGDRTCEYESLSAVRYSPEHFVRKFENQDSENSSRHSANSAASVHSGDSLSSPPKSDLGGSGTVNDYGWNEEITEICPEPKVTAAKPALHAVATAWEIEVSS
mmetsp:Transcript_21777/g.34122  ORF Transcript_21777/g.34122 Transcript_21777/m.34122 type:complete len:476 (-) Transcript_21777:757-2184(-)|eukprot:CAMPEP_0184323402 /NCGR_PEP_ID=MMETSP1049-20130417/130147_1 /TAXON_ID=77928 /ORGANISM="Proteomonas sulcata, Strain CCMP704" /LENGTH=475 /DNA_ID=CAMNT_0026644895 /DNA_START=276 /DNA_END=1703 /DNA_ORIENTATION=+